MRSSKKSLTRSAYAAYFCICVALLLLLGLSVWGAYRDVHYLKTTVLQGEVSRLRSHAERTVGRIERDLEQQDEPAGLEHNGPESWLARHRSQIVPRQPGHYAALVNAENRVVLHSNPALIGRRLERRWYEQVVPELGEDVVRTKSALLAGGEPAYDVRVPVMLNDREIGEYHVGFATAWFDEWSSERRDLFLRRRALMAGGIALVVLLATTSLFYIATHAVSLKKAISQSQLDRANEVAQLAAGLAHEIRNPMHAIRLNLHALAKTDEHRRLKLSPEERSRVLGESSREIQRVETLMKELVNFASPEEPQDQVLELTSEVRSILDFVDQEMDRMDVKIRTQFPSQSALVRFDPNRLRQVLLNLLQNAQQALQGPGQVEISISQTPARVTMRIADNGPGVPEPDRVRVFEPFYSMKKNGSGLGLALVNRYVLEAKGTVTCEEHSPRGTAFVIELPRAFTITRS